MEVKQLTPQEAHDFIGSLMAGQRVVGPQRRGGAVRFEPLTSPDDLCLDYTTTTLPPKKFVMPPREALLFFNPGLASDESVEVFPPPPPEPFTLVGVHPCDLTALHLLNAAMTHTHRDTNWTANWDRMTLVGVDCAPDEHCFCDVMETSTPAAGDYDLFFTDLGSRYLVQVGSEKGRALLAEHATARDADADAWEAWAEFRERKAAGFSGRLKVDKQQLPLLLRRLGDSPVWAERAGRCLSCGACNAVCPTCFCFDVWDEVDLTLTRGTRFRRWDGCLLKDFAKVASGENFREDRVSRYRHRYFRKFEYLPARLDGIYCVGCARCARQCLADIADPVETLNQALESLGDEPMVLR